LSYLINLSVLIASLLLATISSAAEPVAEVSSLAAPFDLASYIEYLADPNDKITYEDIVAGRYEGQWQLNTAPVFIVHDMHTRYWLRVKVHYQQDVSSLKPAVYINSQASLIREMAIWVPQQLPAASPAEAGRIEVRNFEVGHLRPFYNRDIDESIQYAFWMPSTEGTFTLVGWVDPRSGALPLIVPLHLVSEHYLADAIDHWDNVLIAFYAVMCALLLYNGLLFISLKQPLYGYYILFLATAIYMCSSTDSTSAKWLWPERAAWPVYIGDINSVLLGFFYLAFVYEALGKMLAMPRLRKCYQFMFVVGGLLFLYNVISPSYFWANVISQAYPGIILPLTFVGILVAIKLNLPTAFYLLLAELFTLLGGGIFMLMVQGHTPVTPWFLWASHIGFLGETLLLSLALAARTRIAQQESIENLRRFETLYQESADGLFEHDFKTKVTHANRSFLRLFGYQSISEIPLAENPLSFLSEKDQVELPQVFLMNGSLVGYETQISRPETQQKFWISINMRLVLDEKKQPVRVEGSMTDISERKTAEESQRKATENLRQSDKLKNEFLATMSHELRTPMNGIMGVIELLKLEQPDESDNITLLSNSAAEMMKLVNRILDFTQLQAGTTKYEPTLFSLTEIFDSFSKRYSERCSSKSLTFNYRNEANADLTVRSDRKKLTHIVEELLDNAYSFTHKGGVTLSLSIQPYCEITTDASRGSQPVCITVEDTGVGISPSDQEKIFNAFTQADGSFSRSHYGLGLGLVSCKRFAEIMGGTLTLESQLSKGSKITVLLHMEVLTQPKKIDPAIEIVTTDKKLLIVEDNITNQLVLKGILQKLGYETAVAENGLRALEYLSANPVDLILMDCQMPEMDGFETTDRIRSSDGPYKNIPIVAVTANTMSGDRERCLNIGMNDYLGKPVRRDLLQEKLTYWLNRSSVK